MSSTTLIILANCQWSYELKGLGEGRWHWRCERLHPDFSLAYDNEAEAVTGALRAILATVLASAHPATVAACQGTANMDEDEHGTNDLAEAVRWRLGSSLGVPMPPPDGVADMTAEDFSRAIYARILRTQYSSDRAHAI